MKELSYIVRSSLHKYDKFICHSWDEVYHAICQFTEECYFLEFGDDTEYCEFSGFGDDTSLFDNVQETSLWFKTACPGDVLSLLDYTIECH